MAKGLRLVIERLGLSVAGPDAQFHGECLYLEASRTHKTPVSSSSITAVLKRIIAENGRDHVKGYIFAVLCLAVVALTTAFTAWIMETVVNEAFANQRADIVWLIMCAISPPFMLRGLQAKAGGHPFKDGINISRVISAGYSRI